MALGERQDQWLAIYVADGMQLGCLADFGPLDVAESNLFFASSPRGAVSFEGPASSAWQSTKGHHDGLRCCALEGQRREDVVEHASSAPAYQADVEGLVWTVGGAGTPTHQPTPDDMEGATDHLLAIDVRHPARLVGQKRLQARKLDLGELKGMVVHDQSPKVVNRKRQ
ncbi:MAG: hypothetical protein ACJAVR_003005 [Paracoccaceae bacterium]